jgi:hypothetical protein
VRHFLPDPLPGQSSDRVRVSDYRLDWMQPPPRAGFFRVFSPASTSEGQDQDQLGSSRAVNHQLHFTVDLPPSTPPNRYFSTTVQATSPYTFTSRAAEVAYFLVPDTGRFTNGPGTQQLYQLIRRQRLVALTPTDQQAFQAVFGDASAVAPEDVVSAHQNPGKPPPTWIANSMADLTHPRNRLGGVLPPAVTPPVPGLSQLAGSRLGDDVLLSNVISFEVKVLYTSGGPVGYKYPPSATVPPPPQYTFAAFQPNPFYTPPATVVNSDNPYDNLPNLQVCLSPPNAAPPRTFNTFNQDYHNQQAFDTWYAVDPATGLPSGWDSLDPNPSPALGGNQLPAWVRVKGLQIRLRVFDAKLKNARQSVFTIDL